MDKPLGYRARGGGTATGDMASAGKPTPPPSSPSTTRTAAAAAAAAAWGHVAEGSARTSSPLPSSWRRRAGRSGKALLLGPWGATLPYYVSQAGRRRNRMLLGVFISFFGLWLALVLLLYTRLHHQHKAPALSPEAPLTQVSDTLAGNAAARDADAAAIDHAAAAPSPATAAGGSAAVKPSVEDDVAFPMTRRPRLTPAALTADKGLRVEVTLPIEAEVLPDGSDVMLELCTLDLAPYHRNPAGLPKFSADIVQRLCPQGGRSRKSARALLADEQQRQLEPTGFIFHESRVGSTLVANMLASVPTNLVYSEPRVPIHVARQCETLGLGEAASMELLRLAVRAMARSGHHDEVVFKFQSNMVPYMDLVLRAFPDTPWIFIYRDPVEVMVSNIGGGHGSGGHGVCARHRDHPPPAVRALLGGAAGKASKEEYCAAHLAALCDTALKHLDADGSKGHAVAYEGLADEIVDVVVPGHFGLVLSGDERARMREVSRIYSKARNDQDVFAGDAATKQAAATPALRRAAEAYLDQRTEKFRGHTERGRGQVKARAALREREAYVYERTGSRSFALPSCPDEPAYPPHVPLLDIVANWNPNDARVPARHYSTLCRLDYRDEADRAKAARYTDAEVPFVIRNVPELDEAVRRWNAPGYLEEQLGEDTFRVEIARDNHFLYHNDLRAMNPADFVPPTRTEHWTYGRWRETASALGRELRAATLNGSKPATARHARENYYFRVSSNEHPVVAQDLTVYAHEGIFNKEPHKQRGVHCRFGMDGLLAEAHYDGHRNMVVLLGGTRRWLLAEPRECAHAYLRPPTHPSARHSEVDWAAPDLAKYPEFAHMRGLEVLLTPGDALFVPSYWIHLIHSLGLNVQCNSRSGRTDIGLAEVQACGFHQGQIHLE